MLNPLIGMNMMTVNIYNNIGVGYNAQSQYLSIVTYNDIHYIC